MADTLEDILLRHQVYLQRLVPQLGAEQIAMIDKNNPQLRGELFDWLEKNELYKLTKKQQDDLAVLRNKVYRLRGGAINEAGEKYQTDMLDLAEREQLWIANGVTDLGGASIATSSTAALKKMVERQPFVGKTLNQIYSKLSVDDTDRIMTTVSDGLNTGLTKQQIQNTIFGTKKLGYTDGILQQTRNYINNTNTNSGVVRTTINGVQNESKRMLYGANSDIVDKVQYMATLDGRTSDICASRDGKIYKMGSEPPLPAHINCRSTYNPIIDGLDIESTRPYVSDTRTRKEREKDFRAEAKSRGVNIKTVRDEWKNKAIGQVSDKMNYQQWFDKQPAAFQKEKLGKTKYELYKKGGMKFDRFVDPLAKPYTIDELYKLDKDAFKKAGLDKGGKVLPKVKKKRIKKRYEEAGTNKKKFFRTEVERDVVKVNSLDYMQAREDLKSSKMVVSVDELNNKWKGSDLYLGKNDKGITSAGIRAGEVLEDAKGNEIIKSRKEWFKDFLKYGDPDTGIKTPIEAPRITIDANNKIQFINGRHRFAVIRDDLKKNDIVVSVDKDMESRIKEMLKGQIIK